jgi:hypothetical protein
MRTFRENAPGACWLASIAALACYFLYSGLEVRTAAAAARAAAAQPAAEEALKEAAEIVAVKPGAAVSGFDISPDQVTLMYRDAQGALQSLVVTPELAARHVERLRESQDLGEFLRGFGDMPLLDGAPLDEPEALKEWARTQLSRIDRPPAAEFPQWFREPMVEGVLRFDLRPEAKAAE